MKMKSVNTVFVLCLHVCSDCLLFSENSSEREILINNVGVELLPLSVSPSSDSCQQISVIVSL